MKVAVLMLISIVEEVADAMESNGTGTTVRTLISTLSGPVVGLEGLFSKKKAAAFPTASLFLEEDVESEITSGFEEEFSSVEF